MTLVVDDYSATPVHPESMAFCRVAGSLSDVVGLTVQPADEPGLNMFANNAQATMVKCQRILPVADRPAR